jgi:hypothetical protein
MPINTRNNGDISAMGIPFRLRHNNKIIANK